MEGLKVRQAIDIFSEEELEKLQHDLHKGGAHLKNLIDTKLKEKRFNKRKICATCDRELKEVESPYTLIFGPDDFQKKASFCEIDCLTYFLEKIKKIKNRGEQSGSITTD